MMISNFTAVRAFLCMIASRCHFDIPQFKSMESLSQSFNFLFPRTPDCTPSFDFRVCSPEHYDLSLAQHFMNVLWHWYVDHIFLGC